MLVIRQRQFTKELRVLGYAFGAQKHRVMIYRQVGGTNRVAVPRRKELTESYTRTALHQAGATPEQIEDFIAGCQNVNKDG